MNKMTCVVIATSDATREFVAASLTSNGMDVVSLASLAELRNTLETVPVCGILLELTTAITASAHDKKKALEFFDLYPFDKFRHVGNQMLFIGETLAGFVEKCRQFEPRTIRKGLRTEKFLAVYLSADETFDDAEKAVTADISDGGCFICSGRDWSVGNQVWLKFLGVEAVDCGTVRMVRPWGNNEFLPGIGVRIDTNASGIV